MNINQYLKNVGVTKTELASEIGLSRPTLNQYIKQFEMGQTIDNERYDIIFRRLFWDENESGELFKKRLEGVKFLLERDRKYDIGSLEPEAADIVAQIHNQMVQDMSQDGWNKKVYDTILIFLNGYKNNPVISELAGYFSDLNRDSALEELPESTKAYYAYFYKYFREIVERPPEFDQDAYEDFVERKKEILRDREENNNKAAEKVKAMIEEALKELEKEYQEKGESATEEEIRMAVIRKINSI